MKFNESGTYLRRESARTWNRCKDLAERFGENPTAEQREQLEQAAREWLEASAKAGRQAARRG